jgi:hypothetical protein
MAFHKGAARPALLGRRRDRHALAELGRRHQGHRPSLARLGPDGLGTTAETDAPSTPPAASSHRSPPPSHPEAPARPWSQMADYARPSNINSGRSGPTGAAGLDLFPIGLDHMAPGISTDSARGSETTGNNRHASGKPDTRRGRPNPPRDGPPSMYSLGKTAGQATGHQAQ